MQDHAGRESTDFESQQLHERICEQGKQQTAQHDAVLPLLTRRTGQKGKGGPKLFVIDVVQIAAGRLHEGLGQGGGVRRHGSR